jgi:predicted ATPase/DNA-binding winged helix-turn-helix (wHTH) protein
MGYACIGAVWDQVAKTGHRMNSTEVFRGAVDSGMTVPTLPTLRVCSPAIQGGGNSSRFDASAAHGRTASFGSFRLHVTERLLEKDGNPVKIGSRALDILITLLEHAPEVVSKRDLIQRAWGQLIVEDVSLRVHMANLRKRLGDSESLGGSITNVQGRGYCFAGQVTWTIAATTPGDTATATPRLPRSPLLMVGRDDAIRELTAQLKEHRFLSIVGAGGIGKTTVALALCHRVFSDFQGSVHFLDLAPLEDRRLLPRMLASQLGIAAFSENPLPAILAFLREQRLLLVFDSCEHLIDAVAALTENLFRDAPHVHILTTSREALRAEGEQVHHLPPLACPPTNVESLSAAEVRSYSAVQLFLKHVANSGYALTISDDDAPIVAAICRRLDGIALALELAASRVGVHGVRGTASLLDKHFRLLWRGRRTAIPRHQTLRATLDWSYSLLSETEQQIFRRVAIFVAGFSLQAALDVTAEGLDSAEFEETLASLVAKSLVASDSKAVMRYRLSDTTRTYAWQKLAESGEAHQIARRHCENLLHTFERSGASLVTPPKPETRIFFAANLTNLRAALDWCFSDEGDTALGAKLIGTSAYLFVQTGLLTECVTWTSRAIRALGDLSQGEELELNLQATFASSMMVTTGNVPAARAALVRALELAMHLNDAPMQFYLLHALYKWQIRTGDLRGLKELTDRLRTVAKEIADPIADAIADGFRAVTCFFTGNNREVAGHAQAALEAPVQATKLNAACFGNLHKVAKLILARNLWVLGYPDQAGAVAAEAVQEAEELDDPFTQCNAFMSCICVAIDTGNLQRAEELVERLSSIATKHHLLTYARAAVGWQGSLAVSHGEVAHGIELLQTALAALHEDGYELYRPWFSVKLAEGFAQAGHLELASSTIGEAVTWAETRERILSLIELLRVKGEILNSSELPDESGGEACFLKSLHLARERGLLSFELRTGISLAKRWAARGATQQALEVMAPIVGRFTEGFATRDLVLAATLLDELRSRSLATERKAVAQRARPPQRERSSRPDSS